VPELQPFKWAIQKLSAQHDRSAFDCGKGALNDFLMKYAGQNQKLGVSQTYVAVQPNSAKVDGYYAISSGAVEFASVPDDVRKRLPRYPVPVAHLGRLAVDKAAKGKGLGRLLLLDAMERIIRAADSIGICAIEVWAKDNEAKSFYAKYGFVPLLDDPLHLYISIHTIRKLRLTTGGGAS
jgi:ribosomal protein S18 acetylase RimI-like enzyme